MEGNSLRKWKKDKIAVFLLMATFMILCAGCKKTKDSEEEITFSDLQGALSKRMKVSFSSTKEEVADSAIVNVKITSVDVADVIQNVPKDIASEEAAKDYMISEFEKKSAKTKTFQVEISMKKIDDNWYIEMTPELSDALLGGYNSMVDSMLEEGTK